MQHCKNFKKIKIKTTFSFSYTRKDEIIAIIKVVQNNIAGSGEIPLNILRKSNFAFDGLTEFVNYTSKTKRFSDSRVPIFPKFITKLNYRTVSLLP